MGGGGGAVTQFRRHRGQGDTRGREGGQGGRGGRDEGEEG